MTSTLRYRWLMHDADRCKPSAAGVLIRTAKPTDEEPISALLKESFSDLLAPSYTSNMLVLALPYMTKANATLLASETYYVVEAEPGIIVGCGGWTAAKPGSAEVAEGEAHIRHFAIHPKWTRLGIGSSILVRCIGDARSLGVRKLYCFSTLNAEAFYAASGFKTVRLIDVPMAQNVVFPAVLMQYEIA